MSTILSEAEKRRLNAQLAELTRLTREGVRPYEDVRAAVQNIIEGKLPRHPGGSYQPMPYDPGPKAMLRQLKLWNKKRNWGINPKSFLMSSIPRFSAEAEAELLLPVPRLYRDGEDVLAYNFEEAYALWNVPGAGKVSVPRGLGWDEPSPVSFRITPGSPGVVPGESYLEWVAFNPTGIRPGRKLIAEIWADKLQLGKLAGLEVMWAAALMPGWARSWNQKNDHKRLTSSPMIGGLQIKRLNAVSVPPSLGWHSYTIGMEFWANRGPYVGNGAYGGEFGYGYYYIGDLVYGNTPLPTIRPVA